MAWADLNKTTRSDAIRHLVELGLRMQAFSTHPHAMLYRKRQVRRLRRVN